MLYLFTLIRLISLDIVQLIDASYARKRAPTMEYIEIIHYDRKRAPTIK